MVRTSLLHTGLFLCALSAAACAEPAGDEERARRAAALVAQGKDELARNEWGAARATFESVLNGVDPENAQARLGSALADTLFVTDALRYLSSLGERANLSLAPQADDESRYVEDLIAGAIDDVRAKFTSADARLGALEAAGGVTFRIESLPLKISSSESHGIDLGGEWDRADALFLHALVHTALGVLDAAHSVDLGFDFPGVHAYLRRPGVDVTKLAHVESLVTFLLNDPAYPNFLSLRKGGEADVSSAASHLGSAARYLELALASASREGDDQGNDILRAVDDDGDRRFDAAIRPDADACGELAAGSAPDAYDSYSLAGMRIGSTRTHPHLIGQLQCLLQTWRANFALDSGEERPRLRVAGDLVPVADALAAAFAKAQPWVLGDLPVPEGALETVVNEVVGDSMEIDPGAFFETGAGGLPGTVRGILPAWEDAPCAATGPCLNVFIVEMECSPAPVTQAVFPTPITQAFEAFAEDLPVCKKAWRGAGQAGDSAHFAGTSAADGIVGNLPYAQWQDGSFHGVLRLDLAALAALYAGSGDAGDKAIATSLSALDGKAGEFTPATTRDLNAFGAALSANSTVSIVLLELADRL